MRSWPKFIEFSLAGKKRILFPFCKLLASLPFIQYVVLYDEYNIEKDADIPQSQLHWIARYPRPVALQVTIDSQLCNREDATCKVEQDLRNRPAICGVISIICEHLRHVFDKSDQDLDV